MFRNMRYVTVAVGLAALLGSVGTRVQAQEEDAGALVKAVWDALPKVPFISKMTLTTPHCPVAESMPGEVELRVSSVPGVRDAEVNLVWDPPWDPSKMSDEARLELGML